MKKQITAFLLTGIFASVFAQAPAGWTTEANPFQTEQEFFPSLQISVTPATCAGKDGSIAIYLHFISLSTLYKPDLTLNAINQDEYDILHQSDDAFWKLILTDENDFAAEKTSALTGTVTFNGLAKGIYSIELVGKHSWRMEQKVAVKGPPTVVADFEMNFATAHVGDPIYFRNRSQGATAYQWDFSDGSSLDDNKSTSHYFKYPGTYQVTLTAFNNECSSQKTATVTVSGSYPNLNTGITGTDSENTFFATADGDNIRVALHFASSEPARLSVFNLAGAQLASEEIIPDGVKYIHLPFAANGCLLVHLALKGQSLTRKVMVNRN